MKTVATLAYCSLVSLALASSLQGCSATNATPAPHGHAAGSDSGVAGTSSTAGSAGNNAAGSIGTAGDGSGVAGASGTTGTSGASGTTGTAGASGTTSTAGASGTSSTAGASGTTSTAGASGTTSTAGASGTSSTAGASGTTSTAGASGTSSTAGASGTGAAGTAGNGSGMPPGPLCTTEAKGGTCSSAFPEGTSCYKKCGPESVGYKPETCTAGVYVEGACTFDYSNTSINWHCYNTTGAPACAAGTQANTACTVGTCMPCTGTYLDSSAAMKTGNCVCTATMKWSCASATAWPANL